MNIKQVLMEKLASQAVAAQLGLIATNVVGQLGAGYLRDKTIDSSQLDSRLRKHLISSGHSFIVKDPVKFSKFKVLLGMPELETAVSAGKLLGGLSLSAITNPVRTNLLSKLKNPVLSNSLLTGSELLIGAGSELSTELLSKKVRNKLISKERIDETLRRYSYRLK